MHLTQAGEHLLKHAERILREMQDARSGLEEIQNWGHSRLRLGASPAACQYLLPTVLREFKQSFPQCVIRIEAGDGPRMVELLRSNQIDLALMLRPEPREELAFRPLFEDELRLVVPPMHPWAQRGKVARASLADETFILYHKGSYTFRLVEDYFAGEDVTLTNFIELGSMEAIKELVKIGLGVGVLADWLVRKEIAENSLVSFPAGRATPPRLGRRLPARSQTAAGGGDLRRTVRVGDRKPLSGGMTGRTVAGDNPDHPVRIAWRAASPNAENDLPLRRRPQNHRLPVPEGCTNLTLPMSNVVKIYDTTLRDGTQAKASIFP